MNEKHYPAGSSGGKGGQFAPKNGSDVAQGSESSISYAPKLTSLGLKRVFFSDLSPEEQEKKRIDYIKKHYDLFAVNDYLYDNFNTSKINTPERNFKRRMWIAKEFERQMAESPKKRNKKATLLLGLPGSGKSTIATPLSKQEGMFIVDADEFKKMIPEFQKDEKMVSAVHHESVNLADEFMKALSDKGYNMCIGKVGGDYESVEYILNDLSSKGYDVDVILNDLPLDEAIARAEDRFDSGRSKRMIPFWTLKTADKNVFDTFDKVLKHPSVKSGKIYSNDVPEGTAPVLLHEFKK